MEQPGYDVYSQMKRFVDFMGNMTFASPSELTEEQMVEYAMVTIFDDYNGERELYSVDEVSKMVETLFGVSGVDASKTKFYNEEEGGCEMLGRGGMWYYTWTSPAVQDASTRTLYPGHHLLFRPAAHDQEEEHALYSGTEWRSL